jgi:hypothetical protein
MPAGRHALSDRTDLRGGLLSPDRDCLVKLRFALKSLRENGPLETA